MKKPMKGKSRSSRQWWRQQDRDPFVRRARAAGYRARAAYKLINMHQHFALFRPQMTVVDLGAAPGSWSQVVLQYAPGSRILACDLRPIESLDGVICITGDFTTTATVEELMQHTEKLHHAEKLHHGVDLVLSDLAPSLSGIAVADQYAAQRLATNAWHCAQRVLRAQGNFVCKAFHGEGFDALLSMLKTHFATVRIYKPPASKTQSREVYLVALGCKK